FIKKYFPQLPIHTSTQMTITGVEGAKFLKELGIERVVLARELSIAEMKQIREEANIELEAFIHGALCYSYSGQCLFSSLLGGRSGNRGRCAQPCRLPYAILDEKKKEIKKESYILSLKDLCGISYLKQLKEAGVYSLKIEGRMKQASYAAGVVSFYRKYIDMEQQVSKKDMQHLYELGNRCGFTTEYFEKHNDKSMITFEKPSYEKSNEALHKQIEERYVGKKSQLPICGELVLKKGQPMTFKVCYIDKNNMLQPQNFDTYKKELNDIADTENVFHNNLQETNLNNCNSYQVCVMLGEASEARNKPLLKEDVINRMKKTGDSPFVFTELHVVMDNDIFVPNGVLNQLRRDALAKLEQEILDEYLRKKKAEAVCLEELEEIEKQENSYKLNQTNVCNSELDNKDNTEKKHNESISQVICSCETNEQLQAVLQRSFVTTVYADTTMYRSFQKREKDSFLEKLQQDVEATHKVNKEFFLKLPLIFRTHTADFYKSIVGELKM
ncbi:MAG: U32 family peptidase, partial [Lachnospiraceae bacterium]|nr:U32 family peptidase [Lachnospiraceae bacterium]